MENFTYPKAKKHNPTWLSEMWLYGFVTAGLIAISNLVLFLIFRTSQMLAVSAGTILFTGIFLAARYPQQNNRVYLSAILGVSAWAGIFVVHDLFWMDIFGYLLAGLWLLPVIWFFGLPAGFRRSIVFVPSLVAAIIIVILEQQPLVDRVSVIEFSLSRFITPTYFFIFGVFIFLIVLRGFSTRFLSTRMIASMITIVFIPIVILTIVTYSNTKLNDNRAAAVALDQIAIQKSDDVVDWTSNLSNALAVVLSTNESYTQITGLLLAHATGDLGSELSARQSSNIFLADVLAQNGFAEISVLDPKGIILASTRDDLIGSDFGYYEFFWQGKLGPVTIPPRYFPLEDQVSIFMSRPIRSFSNEVVGVLSGRITIDRMISLVLEPNLQPYRTTLSYLVNAEGALLATSRGRPTRELQTDGARALLSTLQNGTSSYDNVSGLPVVGAYRWLPDLRVGVLVEASEEEIYQRLPGIINNNLVIGILSFILAAIAATTLVRSITNPINALVNASQDVVAGNLDIQVETDREDELGTLAEAFNKMTGELKVLVSGLESRVADRTHDLELRSLELQTAALIARDASLASSVNDLLTRTARLIRERFGFYHVGIFLNDDNNEYAVLRAAGGDAGQLMLAKNHKLKIGETGIVGEVSKSGEPRIALDVGVDSVHFRNPLLPYTRSEMALPLKTESRLIGVLDVQSDKINAFDQNDVTIMSILTDQMAIAIERTRLLQESDRNSYEMELALQTQTSRAWREYITRSQKLRGYRYEGVQVESWNNPDDLALKGIASNRSLIFTGKDGKPGCTATIPIRLRGQTLGVLNLQFSTNQVSADTMHLLEEAADRLSLALENARLVQNAQHLASQEQQINFISGQIQQSTDLETILQNTIRELGKALGVPKTFIQIGLTPNKEIDTK